MDKHSKVGVSLANIRFYCLICNMKRIFVYSLLILALVMKTAIMNADTEFQLTQFTTADGLPNNTVRHILQDSKGNIWICTSNGLSCYDGKEFHNYHPVRNGRQIGLQDQRVQKVLEKDGYLWVATAKGMSCFDLKREMFIDYASEGLKVPDFPKKNIHTIYDKRGRTWKVTEDDGLYIIKGKDGDSEHFTTTSKNNPLPTNSLKCIFQDNTGVIWIGTDNLGISQIKVLHNDGVNYMLEGENIRMLMRLDKDRFAVGNRSGDMWIYDSSFKKLISASKREKSTYCVMLDNDNNLWEGTKGAGLFVNGEQKADSPYKDIYALLQDRKGDIWIGTFGAGLICKDKKFFVGENGSKSVRSLIEVENGDIWAGTSNGVYVLNREGVKHHLCVENGMLLSNEIRTMHKDSQGNIYIAEAGEGFAVVDAKAFDKDKTVKPKHFTEADSLVNNMVQSFVEDRDGFIWIATEFGISKLNHSTNAIKNYFFSKNMLNNVFSENCGIRLGDGRIAFGTNNGIILVNPSIYNEGEKSTNINAEDVTVNGQGKSRFVYVVSKWWKSPWAIACYIAIIILVLFIRRKVKRDNQQFHETIEQLNAEKEEIKDHYSAEVRIRREEEKNAQDEDFIKRIEAVANKEMGRASFTSDDFADQMGMGRTAFFNKMKKVTGYSPKEYIKLKRIKRAAELLSTTSTPIGEIAFNVGIEDQLYFSRVFKQVYGTTPTEWRKKAASE